MLVRFWGVRGSLPSAGPETVAFGGNTSCVELRFGDHIVILDAGSGIRPLGDRLMAEGRMDFDLLFSHFHYDHVCGIPFFLPFFRQGRNVRLWSGHMRQENATQHMLRDLMRAPFFPVGPEVFCANVSYHDFMPGNELKLGEDVRVRTMMLNHPGGAIGYRFERAGRSLCYICDNEHVSGQTDHALMAFIADADLVIYDAAYTDEEYPDYCGYGHSTWQEGIRVCHGAGAKRCILTHHRPRRSDERLQAIAEQADKMWPGALIAREGLELSL